MWIDAEGKTQPFFAAPNRSSSPADGKRLAIVIGDVAGATSGVYDLDREMPTKLPTGGRGPLAAVGAPDGKHLVYVSEPASSNNGVMWIRADGGDEPQPPTRNDAHLGGVAASVSPDGRFVLFGTPGKDLQTLTIDTTDPDHPKAGAPEPSMNSFSVTAGRAAMSLDGHWLAYT